MAAAISLKARSRNSVASCSMSCWACVGDCCWARTKARPNSCVNDAWPWASLKWGRSVEFSCNCCCTEAGNVAGDGGGEGGEGGTGGEGGEGGEGGSSACEALASVQAPR